MSKEQIFDAIRTYLGAQPQVKVALIYGSVAKATHTEKSDLDLAIASDRPLSDEEKVDHITAISTLIGREVDLIDLRKATGTVFKEALSTGERVLVRDTDLLARLSSRMVFEDADFHAFRRLLMKERRKKVFDG